MADNTTIIFNQLPKAGKFGSVIDIINSNFHLTKEAILQMRGKSAFEIWKAIPGNENKTIDDFWAFLTADKGYTKQVVTYAEFQALNPTTVSRSTIYVHPNSSNTEYYSVLSNGEEWVTLVTGNDDISNVPRTSDDDADLSFRDEHGYSIVKFENGHIKTKNFDSSEAATKDELDELESELEGKIPDIETIPSIGDTDADLAFSDENGNAIVKFENGHIKTKNFDSANISPTNVSKDVEYPQFYGVGINKNTGVENSSTNNRVSTEYLWARKGDVVKIKDTSIIGGIMVFEYSSMTEREVSKVASTSDWTKNEYTVSNGNTLFIRIMGKIDDNPLWSNRAFRKNVYLEHNTPSIRPDRKKILSTLIPSGWYVSRKSEFFPDSLSDANGGFIERPVGRNGKGDISTGVYSTFYDANGNDVTSQAVAILGKNYTWPTLAELYDGWSYLATTYPDFVTKTELGDSQDGEYKIYKYEFVPASMEIENGETRMYGRSGIANRTIPKIFIEAGIHPAEYPCTRALLNFFTHLCRDWKDDNFLTYLRWNVRFVVIPCVNPYGYVRGLRGNVNHVDINRNFWNNGKWADNPYKDDATSDHYGGVSAFSEKEGQYVAREVFRNADAIAAYDLHTFGSWNSYSRLTTFSALNCDFSIHGNFLAAIGVDVTKGITMSGWKNHGLPLDSGYIGFVQSANDFYGAFANLGIDVGIPTASPELAYRIVMNNDDNGGWCRYSKDVDCMNEEYIGNMILSTLRQYYINF